MSRFKAVPYEDQSEIDLSPMLDVIFIMLIFFIISATFIDEKGLSVTLPSVSVPPDDVDTISVTVEPGRTFLVNGHRLSASRVSPYVRALYSENPDAGYSVLLAPGSLVNDAAVALDAGRRIGVEVVTISSKE